MSLDMLGIGSIIEGVGKVADDLFTSDEERLKIALQEKSIEADLIRGQQETNKAEAQHSSVFVAGWRPFIGWIGGIALAYQFVLYPLMLWGWSMFSTSPPPPVLPADQLWVILSGMLGIAGMRSFDKLKGTDTKQMPAARPKP